MSTDPFPRPHALPDPGPSRPGPALAIDEDVFAVASNHLAGLHRGLVILLSLAILMLLPTLVWSGARSAGRTEVGSVARFIAPPRVVALPSAWVPMSWDATAPEGLLR